MGSVAVGLRGSGTRTLALPLQSRLPWALPGVCRRRWPRGLADSHSVGMRCGDRGKSVRCRKTQALGESRQGLGGIQVCLEVPAVL